MKVPQFVPWISEEDYKACEDCFKDNWITEGPKATEFKKQLLNLMDASYGVFAPNGTLALYLALRSLNIGKGDEVIVPDLTFIASANAVEMAGAVPVFVDVDAKTLQIDVALVEGRITKKTKAIMPVHLFGAIGDMDALCSLAQKNNLLIVEDAAQALGVHYKKKHSGTIGQIGTFSFFADKSITTAEGGFIVTQDEDTYQRLQFLRNQGRIERGTFIHPELGYNFRMTDIQCAIGLSQLNKFQEIIKRKLRILKNYQEHFQNIEEIEFITRHSDSECIPFRVGILCERAHELMEFMLSKEIEPRSFFYPLHNQPCYAYLKNDPEYSHVLKDENFPNTLYAYEHGICLPSFPTLSEDQLEFVCIVIKDFYEGK